MNLPPDLTAADVMSRELVLIPRTVSLKAAAQLLCQRQVSGAPVVDENGRCAGVLSSTDFVRCATQELLPGLNASADDEYCSEWHLDDRGGALPDSPVERFMTADPVTVPPTVPVADLARTMVDAHVHRVIVVDEQGRPIGIVSSMDLLGVLARAAAPLACVE